MLSIAKMGKSADYYLNLSKEDYYTASLEPEGQWFGDGVSMLGLPEAVTREHLSNLLQGLSPSADRALAQMGNGHQTGWDLTFSAPKAVSVLWALTNETERAKIAECHARAVREALRYIQEHCLFTRRGKGGHIKEAPNLVAALFEHGSSRALDPLLHTHCLILNVAPRQDGTTGTIISSPLFLNKMVVGALYRAELAHQLSKEIGLKPVKDKDSFTLEGMPKELAKQFSKRRAEIERNMPDDASASKAAVVTLQTRTTKQQVGREELFTRWKAEAEKFGWSEKLVARSEPGLTPEQSSLQGAVKDSFHSLSARKDGVTERDMMREVLRESQPGHSSARGISSEISRFLSSPELNFRSRPGSPKRYFQRSPTEFDPNVKERLRTSGVKEYRLKPHEQKHRNLSGRDKEVLTHATKEEGGVLMVSGLNSEDRNASIRHIAKHYEENGFAVRVAVPSRKRADAMSKSGLDARSAGRLVFDIEKEPLSVSTLTARDFSSLDRALSFAEAVRATKENLGAKTVVILDNPEAIGTETVESLIKRTQEAGSRLVILGGESESPLLKGIERDLPRGASKRMIDVQTSEQERKPGKIEVHELGAEAQRNPQKLASHSDARTVVLTQDEAQAATINENLSMAKGAYSVGDRVRFCASSRLHGVIAGDFGTVLKNEDESVKVRLDTGRSLVVPESLRPSMKHGYAVTVRDMASAPPTEPIHAVVAFDVTFGELSDTRRCLEHIRDAKFITTNDQASATARTLAETSGHQVANPSQAFEVAR